jgi:hypothetical protein
VDLRLFANLAKLRLSSLCSIQSRYCFRFPIKMLKVYKIIVGVKVNKSLFM